MKHNNQEYMANLQMISEVNHGCSNLLHRTIYKVIFLFICVKWLRLKRNTFMILFLLKKIFILYEY